MKTLILLSVLLMSYRLNSSIGFVKQQVSDKLVNHILAVSKNGRVSLVSRHEAIVMAKAIRTVSREKRIPEEVMVAIIHSESNFVQRAVSKSGDISVAQINMRVWSKFLEKKGYSQKDIKTNPTIAIKAMGEILAVYKKDKKDWYGNYHSNKAKFKGIYLKKVNRNLLAYRLVGNLR